MERSAGQGRHRDPHVIQRIDMGQAGAQPVQQRAFGGGYSAAFI
ncbi:hypothetical protein [uncultured Mameliella sp.]|nr:hypothetical protein [uncultured Mameliella sp.]